MGWELGNFQGFFPSSGRRKSLFLRVVCGCAMGAASAPFLLWPSRGLPNGTPEPPGEDIFFSLCQSYLSVLWLVGFFLPFPGLGVGIGLLRLPLPARDRSRGRTARFGNLVNTANIYACHAPLLLQPAVLLLFRY